MLRFHCPSCGMKLKADPEQAGSSANCPGCNHRFQVPGESAPEDAVQMPVGAPPEHDARGWVESDPANPHFWITFGLGMGVAAVIMLLGLAARKTYLYEILFQRSWVNFAETIFFGWGVGILVMKQRKMQHQRNALLLDVLPADLGREINRSNVRTFLDHVYSLPERLRDSLMVNRLRKGLDLFETRQSNSEVANMMANQSGIDSVRIAGSYSMLKIFVWLIPILGFVGTVLGLSQAIGNFKSVMGSAKDIDVLLSSLGGVTGGLSTAFDTTLLGLLYAIILSLPMSALQKAEDDNLNSIDSFCNETLMPRLNDGSNVAGGDMGGLLNTLTQAIVHAQSQFLQDLNRASQLIAQQHNSIDKRMQEHQAFVQESFTRTLGAFQQEVGRAVQEMSQTAGAAAAAMQQRMQTDVTGIVDEHMKGASQHLNNLGAAVREANGHVANLSEGIGSLNEAMAKLDGKQVVVARRAGFFGRMFGG